MNTKLAVLAACLLLASCGDAPPSTTNVSQSFEFPDGLKDCKVYQLRSVQSNGLYTLLNVVRCPNSSTSVQWRQGKQTLSSITVEEAEPAPPPPLKTVVVNGVSYVEVRK